MKKNLIILTSLLSSVSLFSQVGINTTQPQATLDIVASSNDVTKTDGLIAPRLKGTELSAKDALYTTSQTGAIVYVTEALATTTPKTINITTIGYYYFDGEIWQKVSNGTIATTEPWNIQGTTNQATSNIQNIYQKGSVAIGKDNVYVDNNGTRTNFDVSGAIRGGSNQTGNVGINSFAFGNENEASGLQSIVMGTKNINSANNSAILGGLNNKISFDKKDQTDAVSIIIGGKNNTNTGYNTSIFGGELNQFLTTSLNGPGNGYIIGGRNNKVIALNSNNYAMSNSGIIGGNNNSLTNDTGIANSSSTIIGGSSNSITSSNSTIIGAENSTINTRNSTIIGGEFLTSGTTMETIMGRYNAVTTGSNSAWTPTDPLLQIGNGNSETSRSNALTVLKNGNVGIITTTPTEKFDNSGNTRLRNLPLNGTTNSIYTTAAGTSSPTQNQTFSATRTIVADANGVLGTLPFIVQPVLISGGDGVDAIMTPQISKSKTTTPGQSSETITYGDVLMKTINFTLTTKSLVNISYTLSARNIKQFDTTSPISDGTSKMIGSYIKINDTNGAWNTIPFSNTGNFYANGAIGLSGSQQIVLPAGNHTIKLYGDTFAYDSNGISVQFGSTRDFLDIIATPLQ